MNDIQREIEVMSMLDHPNVVKLFEIYDEPKKMMLVMEVSAAAAAAAAAAARWCGWTCGG